MSVDGALGFLNRSVKKNIGEELSFSQFIELLAENPKRFLRNIMLLNG